ncbi:hypothetical protein [Streptomyces sp. NRRL S-350]|uniref:hypothetical protein n=1 Tax=Streptomyces sp. NRRL S-350 TaxID=1463902 RepID=UPI00131D9CFF|nr:hypothetical protein [Streptomyces sp. NRRL S-350]
MTTSRQPADRSEPGTPPRPDQEVQGAAELVRLAHELGLTETDVDELVYEMVHRGASSAYNNGAHPVLGDLDAFDAVHDDADEQASAINNRGLEAQIAALFGAFGEQQVERMLRDEAPGHTHPNEAA